jgi:hypothetical protein
MSLLVDGILASNVARSLGSTTLLSASYVHTVFPGRRPAAAPFALTLRTPGFDALTVVLACQISSRIDSDVILGLDWKAALRELLLALGSDVPATFDPWTLFLPLGEFLSFLFLHSNTVRLRCIECLWSVCLEHQVCVCSRRRLYKY